MNKSKVDFGSSQVLRVDLPSSGPEDHGYNDFMIEQYKLFVDKTHSYWVQLLATNEFFLKVNTAVLSGFGWLATTNVHIPVGAIACLLSVALVLSFEWFMTIKSFRKLNRVRHEILQEWELKLPAQPHRCEFEKLYNDPPKYYPLQGLFKMLPVVAAVAYVGLTLIAASRSLGVSL